MTFLQPSRREFFLPTRRLPKIGGGAAFFPPVNMKVLSFPAE